MKLQIKKYITIRYVIFFYALIAVWPSVFSYMGWLPDAKMGYVLLTVFCAGFAMISKQVSLPNAITVILLAQLGCFTFYSLMFTDSSYMTRCMVCVITLSLLSIQVQRSKIEFIDTTVGWLTLQALMAIPGFFLTIFGLLHPVSTFIEQDGHYGQFFLLYTTNSTWDGMQRVAGFFDEPGAFAFWGIVALLLNKLFINNNKVEMSLIVGLITTLSMAYFIQIAVYFFLFYKNHLSKLLFTVVAFLSILLALAQFSSEMDHAIFGRFVYDRETGTLQGDNRSESMYSCIKQWQTSPIFGIGAKNLIAKSQTGDFFAGANPLTFLASDGIIGFVILHLPLLYLFKLGRRRNKYKYAALVLLIGILQRPYDPTQLLYPLMLFTICLEGYREVYLLGEIHRSDFSRTAER